MVSCAISMSCPNVTDNGDGTLRVVGKLDVVEATNPRGDVGEDEAAVIIDAKLFNPLRAAERLEVLQGCANAVAACYDPPVVRSILASFENLYDSYKFEYGQDAQEWDEAEGDVRVTNIAPHGEYFTTLYPERLEFEQRIAKQERQLAAHADHINRLEMVLQLIRDDPDVTLESARQLATGAIGEPHGEHYTGSRNARAEPSYGKEPGLAPDEHGTETPPTIG